MLTHSSPEVVEAFQKRQNTTGHEEIWTTTPRWLWQDGYITGHTDYIQNLSTGPNLFAAKAALQAIAREVGVDVNLDGDLEAATFQELINRVRVVVARGQQFEEMRDAEHELSSAYLRVRGIAGALHVPGYWRSEEPPPSRTWSGTETRLRTIVEERDRLKAAIEAVRSATEQAG